MLTDLSAAQRFEALGGGLGGPDSRAGLLGEVGAVGGDVGHDDGGVNRSLFRTTLASSMRGESGRETTIQGMLGSLSFSTSKMFCSVFSSPPLCHPLKRYISTKI